VIYTALGSIALALVMVLSGVSMFGQNRWWFGLVAGVVAAIAWHINHRVAVLLGVVGTTLLVLGIAGFANGLLQSDRAMFNGMTVGFMLCLAIGAVLRWSRVKPHLVELARVERVRWLSKLLGDSPRR
jgi:hypothetical protein